MQLGDALIHVHFLRATGLAGELDFGTHNVFGKFLFKPLQNRGRAGSDLLQVPMESNLGVYLIDVLASSTPAAGKGEGEFGKG